MSSDDQNNSRRSSASRMTTAIAIGLLLGIVFGVAMDNVPMGISIGPAFGIILAVAFGSGGDRDSKTGKDHDESSR